LLKLNYFSGGNGNEIAGNDIGIEIGGVGATTGASIGGVAIS
jgi:hypothetical protein